MSKAPAMPMYWADFFNKTRKLPESAQWAYCRILAYTWMDNGEPFPDDDKILARALGMTPARWRSIRPMIIGFFDVSDDFLRQKNLEKVWGNVSTKIEVNRKNAGEGGRAKARNKKERDLANASKSLEPIASEPPSETVSVVLPNQIQIKKEEEEGRDSYNGKSLPGESHTHTHNTRATSSRFCAEGFEEFWKLWPNHVGKAPALKAFPKALGKVSLAELLDGVRRYTASTPSDRPWLNPATWLNQERWNDEPSAPGNGKHPGGYVPMIPGVG